MQDLVHKAILSMISNKAPEENFMALQTLPEPVFQELLDKDLLNMLKKIKIHFDSSDYAKIAAYGGCIILDREKFMKNCSALILLRLFPVYMENFSKYRQKESQGTVDSMNELARVLRETHISEFFLHANHQRAISQFAKLISLTPEMVYFRTLTLLIHGGSCTSYRGRPIDVVDILATNPMMLFSRNIPEVPNLLLEIYVQALKIKGKSAKARKALQSKLAEIAV